MRYSTFLYVFDCCFLQCIYMTRMSVFEILNKMCVRNDYFGVVVDVDLSEEMQKDSEMYVYYGISDD